MSSIEQLHNNLKDEGEKLTKDFLSKSLSRDKVIRGGVASNTVRAMHYGKCYFKYSPISIYRNWMDTTFLSDDGMLKDIHEESDFKALHDTAIDSLKSFWFSKSQRSRERCHTIFFLK